MVELIFANITDKGHNVFNVVELLFANITEEGHNVFNVKVHKFVEYVNQKGEIENTINYA